MNGSAPFPEDALERSIREYYQRREPPSAPFEQSWAALQTALDDEPRAERARSNFNVAVDVVGDDEVAFILEDTLEDTLEETMTGDEHNHPTTTVHSPRMDTPRRGLSPRTAAIAAVAAALVLIIIAATIFTQLAVRRTPHPAATPTPSAFTKIALPNGNVSQITQMATAPDGSLWYVAKVSHGAVIGHVAPDGTISVVPVPTGDKVKDVLVSAIGVGSDGAVWFTGNDDDGSEYTYFLKRIAPNGTITTIPVPTDLSVGQMIAGDDGALWFEGIRDLNPGSPPPKTYEGVTGEIAPDGHITAHTFQARPGARQSLCVGPDKAIWYAVLDPVGTDLTHLTGRIVRESPSGQVQEFAVPHAPNSIASGSDGALWFSEYNEIVTNGDGSETPVFRKGFIGRITTAGVASELPIDPNLSIDQIVAGSDGAIWFNVDQDETGTFGRITPSGKVKTFTTGGNSGILLIASAPGALWLLDGKSTIWRYRLPA